jgi:hypothetical protein
MASIVASVPAAGSPSMPSKRKASVTIMLNLNHIGQIGLPVIDTDRSEAFYEQVIGLRKLYRFGDLSFFDCAGVRLFLDKVKEPAKFSPQGCAQISSARVS